MKYKILIPFLFYTISIFSQKTNNCIIYIDSLGRITTANESNYKYKRVIKDFFISNDMMPQFEYYKNDTLKMNSTHIAPWNRTKTYYENGKRQSVTTFSTFEKIGKKYEWYENGENKSESEILHNKKDDVSITRILQYWDKDKTQKIIDGKGECVEEDEFEWAKGLYKNGYKTGIWVGKDKKRNLTFSEKYKKGRLVAGISVDSSQVEHKYSVLQKPTGHQSTANDILDFVREKIIKQKEYSELLNENILLMINVNKDGKLTEVYVRPELKNDKIDNIITLMKNQKTWNTCLYRGIPIPFEAIVSLASTPKVIVNNY